MVIRENSEVYVHAWLGVKFLEKKRSPRLKVCTSMYVCVCVYVRACLFSLNLVFTVKQGAIDTWNHKTPCFCFLLKSSHNDPVLGLIPGVPPKKNPERSIFITLILKIIAYFDFIIKHCLLKRMIPRSFDLVR